MGAIATNSIAFYFFLPKHKTQNMPKINGKSKKKFVSERMAAFFKLCALFLELSQISCWLVAVQDFLGIKHCFS
jgi:hypothetical protein